ncbi:MAG: hypothetical protein ACJARE_003808 [Paracoccaceae bacterium]|jgi:hypothetical protein
MEVLTGAWPHSQTMAEDRWDGLASVFGLWSLCDM